MAAKQGLSAQLSQASEDAKRAVLQRTSLHNSLWFSNLNTTCTIKSAPPRSPDVLGLLSVKSGWLFKRNEQHVWQARYCCVVPHTFLYYFDAHPTHPCQTPQLTSKQQEELNRAVRLGYGKRGQSQPRSSLYHVLGGTNAGASSSLTASSSQIPQLPEDTADSNPPTTNNNVQPAGIIDLECYTTIHRNSQNELLMELAGDETVNPDLRSFYFCANTEQEGEEWTQAFLAERHSALTDEREAYKQVCDGFAQQLQVLHSEFDQAMQQTDTHQKELYRVRSQMEDTRRTGLRMVHELLEREKEGIVPAKKAYKADLETIQSQDLGILPAVQLLCDYTRVLEEFCNDSAQKNTLLNEQLLSKQQVDTTKVKELESEIEKLKEENKQQQAAAQAQIDTLTQKYLQAQKESHDVQKDLASQRLEMTMHQSSTRTKLGELHSHKKILKKEVIDLRKKLEEANSELDLYLHRESSVKLEAEQERQKSKLLERYVEKIESQVKVQQNMMEMMSQAGSVYGGASVVGGSPQVLPVVVGGSGNNSEYRSSRDKTYKQSTHRSGYNEVSENTTNLEDQDDPDDGDNDQDGEEEVAVNLRANSQRRGRRNIEDADNKSHMSELTEDRTQKQFDAALLVYSSNPQLRAAMQGSPRSFPPHMGPPAIIGIAEESSSEQIGSGSGGGQNLEPGVSRSGRPPKAYATDQSPTRRSGVGERSIDRILNETASISSTSKLSVAHKARLDADHQTTPVRIRMNQTPLRGNNSVGKKDVTARRDSFNDSRGFFANIGRRLEEAIDNSVLGVDMSDTEGSEYDTTDEPTDTEHEDEKKSGETASDASTVSCAVRFTH
jgi:hypothetical protein